MPASLWAAGREASLADTLVLQQPSLPCLSCHESLPLPLLPFAGRGGYPGWAVTSVHLTPRAGAFVRLGKNPPVFLHLFQWTVKDCGLDNLGK